jgi:hypothetical protein
MVAPIFVHSFKLQTYMVENKSYQEQFGNASVRHELPLNKKAINIT